MATALQNSLIIGLAPPTLTLTLDRRKSHHLPTVHFCTKSTQRQAGPLAGSKKGKKGRCRESWLVHRSWSEWSQQKSIFSARVAPIQARAVQFKARREVDIPFREGAFPAEKYLNELERVVKVIFPDSARITYLGDSVWRTRSKPITFFSLSVTPVCDVRVFNKGSILQIHSDQLLLDFSGLPEEFINQSVRFNLEGQLQVNGGKGTQHKAGRQVYFIGAVSLTLGTNLPLPFSLLPETAVTTVGDSILDTILGAMESALVTGLIADYHSWCWTKQSVESNRGLRVSGSM